MKKVFGIAAMLLALAACNKIETEIQTTDQAEGITITAQLAPKTGGADTRAVSEGSGMIVSEWAVNEHIAVLYEVSSTKYVADAEITAVDGGGTATIEFTVEAGTPNNTPCTLVYPLSAAKDDHTGVKDAATLLAAQDGTLNANLDVRVGEGTIQTTTPGLTVSTQPEAQFAIFKFTTKNAAGTATINVKPLTITIGAQNYVIDPASATSTLYAALPAVSGQTVSFSATGSDSKTYTASKASVTFSAGKYYQSNIKLAEQAPAPTGAINGKFTVNADGDQVYFSKGNLRATYNGSAWSWAFATNQWDIIGNEAANTSINGNGTISGTGTVDLFGWVGVNSAFTGTAIYGITNSTTANQYGNTKDEALKSDWGNTIGAGWYTLTIDEWTYVLNTRTTTSGVRYAKATVNGIEGLILLPDDWSTGYYSLASTNTTDAAFTSNEISSTDWTNSLEAHGAVFLPACGYRNGTTVTISSPNQGFYWSSTSSSSNALQARRLNFNNIGLNLSSSTVRTRGHSVRLVYDVE
jgi:hypothetical protein